MKNLVQALSRLALALALSTTTSTVADAQSYTYDEDGRLRQVTYGDGTTILYSYDASGNPTAQETTPEPPSSSSSGGCFIATAAYGSALDPHVQSLRDFRDAYLLTNAPGRLIIDAYEVTSPPIAAVIADSPVLRFLTRVLLAPIVLAAAFPRIALALLLAAAVIRFRRRRARRLALP